MRAVCAGASTIRTVLALAAFGVLSFVTSRTPLPGAAADLLLGARLEASRDGAPGRDKRRVKHPDYIVRSTPDNVTWGEFPSSKPPVLVVRSGDTVRIETLSHAGATQGNNLLDAGGQMSQNLPACHPGRLWSLWDIMVKFDSLNAFIRIQQLELWICRCKRQDSAVTTQYDKMLGEIDALVDVCKRSGLEDAAVQIQLLRSRLKVDVGREKFEVISSMLRTICQQFLLVSGRNTFLRLTEAETKDYESPLSRFGISASKFPAANDAMAASVRCYVLNEWDASVFQSMRVLEHGLRWLAGQINAGPFPLTLSRPVEMECWENIIGNIRARIDQELAASVKRTPERDELLSFYGKAAAEFRYFKDAWRNHIMHDRHEPHDHGTSGSVLAHVTAFMHLLADRV